MVFLVVKPPGPRVVGLLFVDVLLIGGRVVVFAVALLVVGPRVVDLGGKVVVAILHLFALNLSNAVPLEQVPP